MAVLPIRIQETGRQRLSTLLWVVHWICAICGLSIILVGLYLRIRIQDKVSLVEGFNGNALPMMLITIGVITTVVDLAGGQLCQKVADITLRERLKSLLLPYLLLFVALNVCIFVAGCMCFAHRYHLHQSFHRGLGKALAAYKDKKSVKYEINQLQVEFECCGNEGYEDWFAIQWIGGDYFDSANALIQSKMTTGRYLSDDVPYSCCKHGTLRPCIHHHVQDNDRHFNYDYRTGLTLHERGCKHALMDYFTARLNRIGAVIMTIFLLQSVIFLLLRYLQTSIKNAYDQGDPEETARGWLLANVPFSKKSDAVDDMESASLTSDDSFGIVFQSEGPDWDEMTEPDPSRAPRRQEPIYENIPWDGRPDDLTEGLAEMPGNEDLGKSSKKKEKKSESDQKTSGKSKGSSKKPKDSSKKSGSTKKSDGSTKKSDRSTKKSDGTTKKTPGSTKKPKGSTKKSAGSTKKSPGSTKKSPGSTKKSPGSTKKSPGSTKKSPGSTKKSPGSTKKSPGSTKKSPGSTKKSPGSTKKSPGSTKKSPGSTKKSSGSTKKSSGSARKSPGSTKKSQGSTRKAPASSARKSTKTTSSRAKPKKTGGKKPRMKNRNNNIASDDYSYTYTSSGSSGESDRTETPLLRYQRSPPDSPRTAQGHHDQRRRTPVSWWSRPFRRPSVSTYVRVDYSSDSSDMSSSE